MIIATELDDSIKNIVTFCRLSFFRPPFLGQAFFSLGQGSQLHSLWVGWSSASTRTRWCFLTRIFWFSNRDEPEDSKKSQIWLEQHIDLDASSSSAMSFKLRSWYHVWPQVYEEITKVSKALKELKAGAEPLFFFWDPMLTPPPQNQTSVLQNSLTSKRVD